MYACAMEDAGYMTKWVNIVFSKIALDHLLNAISETETRVLLEFLERAEALIDLFSELEGVIHNENCLHCF
jgi:hypothetical protein